MPRLSPARPTRDALRRQWVVLRTSYALGAASWGTQYLVLLAVGRPVSPYLALSCYCDGFGTLLFTLFFTERVRGRIHRSLGLGWNGKPETSRSLAAVAAAAPVGEGQARLPWRRELALLLGVQHHVKVRHKVKRCCKVIRRAARGDGHAHDRHAVLDGREQLDNAPRTRQHFARL